jgi:Amt family ammonium transporter
MDIAPITLAYLLPIGVVLIAWGSWDADRARDCATTALWVMALAAILYAAFGFAFQFGSIGLRVDAPFGLHGLDRMWSPIGGPNARDWGMIGLEGFWLNAQSTRPGDTAQLLSLFLHQLPIVLTAALIPALALAGRARSIAIALVTIITAGALVPLAGQWAWGGGWLFSLGHDTRFGHGFIDPGGVAATFTTSGFITLAALIALKIRRSVHQPSELTSIEKPLRSIFGAILFGLGWMAWLTTDPVLLNIRSIDLAYTTTNVLLGAAASTLLATLYGWFTTGKPNPHLAARGALSGWIALTAPAPFVPAWAALAIGAIAGLWTPIGVYIIDRWLHLDDQGGAVATSGFAGLWSIVAAGLLADGTYGAGWNNIGTVDYLGTAGQGVTGLLASANLQNDPGQMSAQLTGAIALTLLAIVITWLIVRPWRRFKVQ